jgi:urea transport system substrate-binding protein
VQYGGLEQSPNIVYTGATPNQQILPAVTWAFTDLGRKFFFVGSDYVFPRVAHAIMRDQIEALGGDVVGEEFRPLGALDFDRIVQEIVARRPDVIVNTINGDSNAAFFRTLRKAGVSSTTIPTLSFSIAENEVRNLGVLLMVGDYAAGKPSWRTSTSAGAAAGTPRAADRTPGRGDHVGTRTPCGSKPKKPVRPSLSRRRACLH